MAEDFLSIYLDFAFRFRFRLRGSARERRRRDTMGWFSSFGKKSLMNGKKMNRSVEWRIYSCIHRQLVRVTNQIYADTRMRPFQTP